MTVIPDFDPAKDRIYERKMIAKIHDDLHNASSKFERRGEDVAQFEQRNAYLEGELKLQDAGQNRNRRAVLIRLVSLR